MTTDSYIRAAAGFPLFIDPYVAGARSHWTGDRVPHGTNRYINLSGSLIRNGTSRDHYHNQKGQFYNFTLHMLVFKFND